MIDPSQVGEGPKKRSISPEQIKKMADARHQASLRRKEVKATRRPVGRPKGSTTRPAAERAPQRSATTPLTQAIAKDLVDVVAELIGWGEAGVFFTLNRTLGATPRPRRDEAPEDFARRRDAAEVTREKLIEDRLDEWETRMIAEAFVAEAVRYDRLREWMIVYLELRKRSTLPMALSIVAAPRMVRHGIIPQEFHAIVLEVVEAARKARRGVRTVIEMQQPEPEAPADESATAVPPFQPEPAAEKTSAA